MFILSYWLLKGCDSTATARTVYKEYSNNLNNETCDISTFSYLYIFFCSAEYLKNVLVQLNLKLQSQCENIQCVRSVKEKRV